MDFDPVSKKLWDTENGLRCCDEINLVEPGFNSGWDKVQGIWYTNQTHSRDKAGIFDEKSDQENTLINFNGAGKYSGPEFVWDHQVGPSALKFFNSTAFGKEYKNDMFVGNVNTQTLYHFDLTPD